MLEEICRELNNWFDTNPNDGSKNHYFGTFVIEDGTIDLSETDIQPNQHFRIIGSVFNDGVYQYPATGLTDETFVGAVWAMAVPGVNSMAMSPYTSESFGGYSYSKSRGGSGSGSSDSGSGTWQSVYANRLNRWRKIRAI